MVLREVVPESLMCKIVELGRKERSFQARMKSFVPKYFL